MNNMNTTNPDCPKNMKAPIEILEMHLRQVSGFLNDGKPHEERDRRSSQIENGIALLKAHEGLCQCGSMPGDENAALWDLGNSLSVHHDFLKAYQGTPKGDYHARCIREIQQAIRILEDRMTSPKVGTDTDHGSVGMSFGSALNHARDGKFVARQYLGQPRILTLETQPTVLDMIATDWRVVE